MLLAWMAVLRTEPVMPGWISDSRATLAFRVGQWEKVSGKLQAEGKTSRGR